MTSRSQKRAGKQPERPLSPTNEKEPSSKGQKSSRSAPYTRPSAKSNNHPSKKSKTSSAAPMDCDSSSSSEEDTEPPVSDKVPSASTISPSTSSSLYPQHTFQNSQV